MTKTASVTSSSAPAVRKLGALLHELTLPDDAAELRHLVELCRHSPRIRAWLFGRFANDVATQTAFRAVLSGGAGSAAPGTVWSPVLQRQVLSEPRQWDAEPRRFGGLTEAGVLTLIKRYQAGYIDETIFLLVRCWLRFLAAGTANVPVALWRPTLQQWAGIVSDARGRLARHLAGAVQFFGERAGRPIGEADFGYPQSWKIHVLVYILEHPKPCYRVGELHEHLPAKFQRVGCNKIRTFCSKHGIRRDTRAGRRLPSWRATAAQKVVTRRHSSGLGAITWSHPQ